MKGLMNETALPLVAPDISLEAATSVDHVVERLFNVVQRESARIDTSGISTTNTNTASSENSKVRWAAGRSVSRSTSTGRARHARHATMAHGSGSQTCLLQKRRLVIDFSKARYTHKLFTPANTISSLTSATIRFVDGRYRYLRLRRRLLLTLHLRFGVKVQRQTGSTSVKVQRSRALLGRLFFHRHG